MPRMPKYLKEEWAFFLDERGRKKYNELCRKCERSCKQKSRDTGEKTRRRRCHKRTADTVYPLKRKAAVADGGFSFSGSIQEVIKFRE